MRRSDKAAHHNVDFLRNFILILGSAIGSTVLLITSVMYGDECFANYMHGIQKMKFVNSFTFLQRIFLPLICAWGGGSLWGVLGVFVSFVISEGILTLIIIVVVVINSKKFPNSIQDFMILPKSFGVPPQDYVDFTVTGMDEVIGISKEISIFCKEHNIGSKRSYFLSLAMEEMAGNVVKHGFCDGKKHYLSIWIYKKNNDLHLRLRDDCPMFDVKRKIEESFSDGYAGDIGMKLVMGVAKDVISYIDFHYGEDLCLRFFAQLFCRILRLKILRIFKMK